MEKKYPIELRTRWECPKEGGPALLTMPNIPKPLHNLAPRVFFGQTAWDRMRKRAYYLAKYKSEISGELAAGAGALHCLERGTQVLTIDGWKNIEEISLEDNVAQFSTDTQEISFVNPIKLYSHFEREILEIGYKKGFSMGVSTGHRILVKNKRDESWRVYTAANISTRWPNYIPASGKGIGDGALTIDERLMIALQADGSFQQKNKTTGEYCFNIRVKKKRKIERLEWLISQTSFRHTRIHDRDYVGFLVWANSNCKIFPECFQHSMSYEKARAFIDELVKWDGWEGTRTSKGYTSYGRCYYTSEKKNIDFVQAIAAQAGFGTHLTMSCRKTRNWADSIGEQRQTTNAKPAYNLEIKTRAEYGMATMSKRTKEYNDYVFCIQVPSSFFVARTKGGDVFITGNCHEAYDIDYEKGTSTFKRGFAITPLEHVYFIHSGRALTLHKKGNPMYSAKKLLEGAEHGFKLIHDWNKAHPDKQKLKVYSTFLEYLKCDDLKEGMEKLINQYEMEFWEEDEKKCAKWGDWKVVVGNKEYPTPYKSYEDWEKAMEKQSQKDPDRNFESPFKGGAYDEIASLLAK